MKNPLSGTFRSLSSFNFRLWTAGALISNIGTWMQRVAQDWLVLTQLTHHDASALGVVMALQFAPQLLFLHRRGDPVEVDLAALLGTLVDAPDPCGPLIEHDP